MPNVSPFKAYRYSDSVPLKRALCPPYDVISETQAQKLRQDSSNAIHVELPSGSDDKKYENARQVWKNWIENKTVSQDSAPAFYVYEQRFLAHGKRFSRKGFFCEVGVEKPGEGSILRHELTLSGPKQDRLNLLRTLKVNSSPIFGLFNDSKKNVTKILARVSKSKPRAHVEDGEKVVHKLWPCSNAKDIAVIRKTLKKTPIFIADGHHRYETSWNYRQETISRGDRSPWRTDLAPGHEREKWKSVLFFVCPMQDPGLVVFPTHRVLVQKITLEDIAKRLRSLDKAYKTTPLASSPLQSLKNLKSPSFIVTDGRTGFEVSPKSPASSKKNFPQKPPSYVRLSLVHLHSVLLPDMKKEDFIYTHDEKEAVQLALQKGTVAFLVPAATVRELYTIVKAGELMPQKSTYFYPKIITGMVFRSLEE